MSHDRSRILVAVRVPCEPTEAFVRFTAEIGQWWQPIPLFQFSDGRDGTLAFETGEGGRLIETYHDGTAFVICVISTWAPPRRLVLSWRHASFPHERGTGVARHLRANRTLTDPRHHRALRLGHHPRRPRGPPPLPLSNISTPLRRMVAQSPPGSIPAPVAASRGDHPAPTASPRR